MIDFVGKKKIFFSVSILLLIASIVVSFFPGVKLDIQFRGGAILTYEYEGELSKEDVQKTLSQNTSERVSVQESTDINTQKKNLVVSITSGESLTEDEAAAITKSLQDAYKDNGIKSVGTSNVDPTMGREFFAKCLVAVAFAALLMIVYIGFRFRKIGGWSAGCMAVVALLHDAMIVYAVNVIFGFSISDSFMAVVLTIIGYSINSTIVVYDRVRENKRLYGRKLSTAELVNKSINQSLRRACNTTLTTLIALVTMLVVGFVFHVDTIVAFVLPMIAGMISGFYTSLCLSGPLWVTWQEYKAKKKASKTASAE